MCCSTCACPIDDCCVLGKGASECRWYDGSGGMLCVLQVRHFRMDGEGRPAGVVVVHPAGLRVERVGFVTWQRGEAGAGGTKHLRVAMVTRGSDARQSVCAKTVCGGVRGDERHGEMDGVGRRAKIQFEGEGAGEGATDTSASILSCGAG